MTRYARLASPLDGERGAREGRGDGVEVDRKIGHAPLGILHLGDLSAVAAQEAWKMWTGGPA